MAGTAERICAKFTRKSLNVKVKSQRSRSPGTKRAVHLQHPAVWTEWNALVAENVAQAADATIRGDVFAEMRALGLAGYCSVLPRISSFHTKISKVTA